MTSCLHNNLRDNNLREEDFETSDKRKEGDPILINNSIL